VNIVSSAEVAERVRASGGRCFEPVPAEGFELFVDTGPFAPPEALHFEVKGRREKRVEAYWNGCAFVL